MRCCFWFWASTNWTINVRTKHFKYNVVLKHFRKGFNWIFRGVTIDFVLFFSSRIEFILWWLSQTSKYLDIYTWLFVLFLFFVENGYNVHPCNHYRWICISQHLVVSVTFIDFFGVWCIVELKSYRVKFFMLQSTLQNGGCSDNRVLCMYSYGSHLLNEQGIIRSTVQWVWYDGWVIPFLIILSNPSKLIH